MYESETIGTVDDMIKLYSEQKAGLPGAVSILSATKDATKFSLQTSNIDEAREINNVLTAQGQPAFWQASA